MAATPNRKRALWVVMAIGLFVALIGGGCTSAPEAMQVVVSPHPDDEVQGWAKVREGSDALFTVFVVLTHGEQTGNCNGATGLQRDLGERPPTPMPSAEDKGSGLCGQARLDSWHAFMDDAAPTVHTNDALIAMSRSSTDQAIAWVGVRSARVAYNAGDGNVTEEEVQAAVHDVLNMRGTILPDLRLERLVATGYWNDSPDAGINQAPCPASEPCPGDSRDYEYEHLDHAAVSKAVRTLATEASDGAWVVTHPHSVDATEEITMTREVYEELMGVGTPDDEGARVRKGAQQVNYGWLSFPGAYWEPGETASGDAGVLFPRSQAFEHVKGQSS